VAQEIESLPSKLKAPDSNSSPAKKKREREKEKDLCYLGHIFDLSPLYVRGLGLVGREKGYILS
jgi:hypothetical protein